MKLVNLTPHPINVKTLRGYVTLPTSGRVARVEVETFDVAPISVDGKDRLDVWVVERVLGAVVELPPPQPDTLFVVSQMVAEAATQRGDLLFPTSLERDENDRIIAAREFGRVPQPDGEFQRAFYRAWGWQRRSRGERRGTSRHRPARPPNVRGSTG